jgi:hypothetical protein
MFDDDPSSTRHVGSPQVAFLFGSYRNKPELRRTVRSSMSVRDVDVRRLTNNTDAFVREEEKP